MPSALSCPDCCPTPPVAILSHLSLPLPLHTTPLPCPLHFFFFCPPACRPGTDYVPALGGKRERNEARRSLVPRLKTFHLLGCLSVGRATFYKARVWWWLGEGWWGFLGSPSSCPRLVYVRRETCGGWVGMRATMTMEMMSEAVFPLLCGHLMDGDHSYGVRGSARVRACVFCVVRVVDSPAVARECEHILDDASPTTNPPRSNCSLSHPVTTRRLVGRPVGRPAEVACR